MTALKRPLLAATAALLLATSLQAAAQAWPSRGIRVLVGVAPGGVTDLAARVVSPYLGAALGQQIVVENRPGSGGLIGVEAGAKAPPDGYTLLMATSAEMTVNPGVFPKLPYDSQKDFAPIGSVCVTAVALAVHSSVPVNNVAELIAFAKARPGRLAYASAGNGTVNHLAGEWFKGLAGVDLIHVPYKGGGPATQDVVAGQVPVGVLAVSTSTAHARAGKIKLLAVSTPKRLSFAPDWPTIAESGFPGFDASIWVGLFAQTAVPREVVVRTNAELNKLLRIPEVRERFGAQGTEVLGGTPEELAAMIRNDIPRYGKLAREYNIRPD